MDALKKWAELTPHAVALKDAGSRDELTYEMLDRLSSTLAEHLASARGLLRADRVAVLATNKLDYVTLFFALSRLGAVMIPLNYRLTARELSPILSDCKPHLIIHQSPFTETLLSARALANDFTLLQVPLWSFDQAPGSDSNEISLSAFLLGAREKVAFSGCKADAPQRPVSSRPSSAKAMALDSLPPFPGQSTPCMILYTSGTTGRAKGAVITWEMLYWNALNTAGRLDLKSSDVTVGFLPFFHTSGWNVLLTPFIHYGAKTVLLRRFDSTRILELCESERVTILFGVPTTMDMIRRSDRFQNADLSSVRYAIVGGEALSHPLIRAWHDKKVPVRQGYGLTEVGPNVFSLDEDQALRKIGSIGTPNEYVEAKVTRIDGHECAPGEVGELLLRGAVCTPGYWNDPAATRDAFRDGWFCTGDLVTQDAEGYFYVTGRKQEMFISGGENVYPIEVEQFLSEHPAIAEVAVVGMPSERWGETGHAYVVSKPGTELNSDELLRYCRGGLAKYKIPSEFQFVDALPRGQSGKVLKRNLAK